MRVRSLGYRTDLAVRAAEGAEIADCGDHVIVRTASQPDFWWGNFLLLAAPPHADDLEGWLARFAELFPGSRHRTFGIDVDRASAVVQSVFTAAGFRVARDAVLTASVLSEPPQPNRDAVIRRLSENDDWRQAADLEFACAGDDPGTDQEFAARRMASRRRLTEAGSGIWLGAFAGQRLAATLGIVPAGDGQVRYQDVQTHPAFRRQGLAGTLTWRAGQLALDELGARTLVIVADPGYAAIRIYESLGFSQVQEQIGFELPP